MNIEQINLKKKAYAVYNLYKDDSVDKKVISYAKSRVEENRDLFETLIKVCGDEITFDELLKVFDEESGEGLYKKEKTLTIVKNSYYSGVYTTSVGSLAVEVDNTLDALRYFIKAVKSRNAITISDLEYLENDVKNCLMLIFKSSLEKHGLDPNLIDIMPFEECYYERFDKAIIVTDNVVIDNKQRSDKYYIYIDDDKFKTEAFKDLQLFRSKGMIVELLSGTFEKVLEKINSSISKGASIYTSDGNNAFRFINLVDADNVFVNASLDNVEEVEHLDSSFYHKKKIMYPVG